MEVVFGSDELATVRLDGMVRGRAFPRGELPTLLGRLTREVSGPCRVAIAEADGRVYRDVLDPDAVDPSALPTMAAPKVPPAPIAPIETEAANVRLIEFRADGFVPGEDVAVAVVLRRGSAGPDGVARALVTEVEVPCGAGDVLLFGYVSGAVVTGNGLR